MELILSHGLKCAGCWLCGLLACLSPLLPNALPDPAPVQEAASLDSISFDGAGLPVYLPGWLPAQQEDGPAEYHFAAHVTENSWEVKIFDLCGIPADKLNAGIENLPLANYRGRISGVRSSADMRPATPETIPGSPAEHRELLPGIDARCYASGTDVRWEQGGWEFRFTGGSGRWAELEAFAEQWLEIAPAAENGRVEIYQNSVFFEWREDGGIYTCETYSLPPRDALQLFAGLGRNDI